ncbi:mitochondrial carrier domain-containing protein [Spinellus fusiger]|nr:mitochondrial carrier domain-containing protein [Spinellus fusiger]
MSPVLGLAGLNAILFASYGGIMRYFESSHSQPGPFEPSLSQIYVAGCGAGIASFFFSAPTDLVKLQAQVSKVPKSSWNVAKSIYTNNGFRGFYQGGWATMIRDAPSYGLYFFVYEGTKRLLAVSEEETVDNASAIKILIAGGMAGVVSWTAIYPLDVIKSRLQMQVLPPLLHPTAVSEETRLHGQPVQPYTSIRDCIVRSYKTEGAGVFFRGIGPTILRGFPVNAVTFWVYELTLKAFLL